MELDKAKSYPITDITSDPGRARIRTDFIELEIFAKIFSAIAEQMAVTVAKTSHTTFVRETQDFATALATVDGFFYAYPRTLGSSTLLGLPFADCINAVKDYQEGDFALTNDPFLSKAGCTHVPDITVWSPVFVGKELLCFTWGFIHSSDMGGSVPGSIAPGLTDTFQEGIRIPPMKLYSAGKVNEEVRAIMVNNVRIPQQMWGDVQALRAGHHVAIRKLKALAQRHGVEKMRTVMEDLLTYSELKARNVFKTFKPGTYSFSDYLEDDTISDVPVRISLAMTVNERGDIHLDYTGTDPQVDSSYNVPTSGKVHPWVIAGLMYFIVSQDPDIPTNAGFFRAITVNLPLGSLVNAIFPAAIGLRSLTGVKILETMIGVIGQAAPDRMPAAGSGVSTVVLLSVPDYERSNRRNHVINPCVGGSGGRPVGDGFDGVDFTLGFMRNTPAEILEAETFIVIRKYGFVPDSGGAGKFRGGLGIQLEFQVFAPDATVIARGMDRTRFHPWGVQGGRTGARMAPALLNAGTDREQSIRKINFLKLVPGDRVRITSSGGGGYGDPFEREPENVRLDVELGYVSPERAAADYGVIVDKLGHLDEAATLRKRGAPRAERQEGLAERFCLGAERERYESFWTPAALMAMAEILARLPILVRYRIKNAIHARLFQVDRSAPITKEEINRHWADLRSTYYPERYLAEQFLPKDEAASQVE
jgi:N-methylhydantoinase B